MKRNKEKHPTTLNIMGAEWVIKYVDRLKDDNDDDLMGETDIDKYTMTINIKDHESEAELGRTILHETLHAIMRMTGQNEMLSEKQEEAIVRAFEQGLCQLYRI